METRLPTVFLLIENDANESFFIEQGLADVSDAQVFGVSDVQHAQQYLLGKDKYADRLMFPLPDIILLDLKMPPPDGFDFLIWIRNQTEGRIRLTPVVVITCSDLEEDIDHAYQLGANAFITKPPWHQVFERNVKALGKAWCWCPKLPAAMGTFPQHLESGFVPEKINAGQEQRAGLVP